MNGACAATCLSISREERRKRGGFVLLQLYAFGFGE
jgi:hypothetical protein